ATRGSGASNARAELTRIAKGDPDAQASAKETPGEPSTNIDRAASEDYAHRAYPGDEIPWQAQDAARKAFMKVNAKFLAAVTANTIFGQLNNSNATLGKFTPQSWTPVGSASADYPGVLTFFGHDYTASGRTTAMAIAPSCTEDMCQMWIGAAGG